MLFQIGWVLFYPALLVLLFMYIFRYSSLRLSIQKHWKIIILFSVLLTVFLNLYTYWHMSQEHFIYYWDFSGFWRRQIEVLGDFYHQPQLLFRDVLESIRKNEYSSFPQILLLPHTVLLGNTYPRFVLAMVNSFLIPSQILFFVWFTHLSTQWNTDSKWTLSVIGVFLIFFTGNYLPLMLGYVGSGGLIWIILVLIIMGEQKLTKVSVLQSILIGLILVVLVFIRRWFSYFVVSYFVVTPLAYFLDALVSKSLDWKKFTTLLIQLTISGLTALLILFVGFRSLISTFTSYDYKYAYQSVYTGLQAAWPWFINFYSPFQTALLIIGIGYGLWNVRLRRWTLFSCLSIVLIIVMFYNVQIFGSHHYYIINILSEMLICFGLMALINVFKNRVYQSSIVLLVSFLFLGNFSLVFLKYGQPIRDFFQTKIQAISSQLNAPPRVNSNVELIQDMVIDLQNLAQDYEYIYVLAGSGRFNDDMLRNAFLPDQYNPLPTIESTRSLDTRDGLPLDFFNYTYILVADPIQYHNGAAFQHVIGDLAEGMLHDTELQNYYYLHKTYALSGDITVYLYERINDIPEALKEKYRSIYRTLFPNNPELYNFH